MPKKIIYHSAFAIGLFIFSLFFYNFFVTDQDPSQYVKRFEQHLHEQEKEIRALFSDTKFFADILHKTSNLVYKNDLSRLEQISKKPYHVSLFKGDSLVYWSNNKVGIPKNVINETPTTINLANGLYQSVTQELDIPKFGKVKAIGLIPIKYNYKSQSKHLKSYLAIDDKFPSNIKLSTQPTPYKVESLNGNALCYFTTDGPILGKEFLPVAFILFFLALLFNVFSVNLIANKLNEKSFKKASLYLILSIFVMMFIFYFVDFEAKFGEFQLFKSISKNDNFHLSYAAIILDILFGLWMLLFVLENFRTSIQFTKKYLALANGILLSTGIVITVMLTIFAFKSLILDTNQEFNFYKSIQLAVENPLGLLTIILMTMIQFVLGVVLMNMIKTFNYGIKVRYAIYGISVIALLLLNKFTGLNMVLFILIPYIAILFIGLDLYLSEHNKKLVKGVWLFGLPMITTFMLINFHTEKENNIKLEYAKILAEDDDSIAEQEFANLKSKIETEPTFSTLSNDTLVDYKVLKDKMEEIFSESGYLINYYNFDFYVYNDKAKPLIKNQKSKQNTIFEVFNSAKETSSPGIKLYKDKNKDQSYYLMRLVTGQSTHQPKEFFINLYKNKHPSSKIYTELLAPKKFKGLEHLDHYDYAIYNSRGLVYKSNNSFSSGFDFQHAPPPGKFIETTIGNEAATIYQNENNVVTILKNVPIGNLAKTSLFAILYISVFLIIITIGSLNSFHKFLPDELGITFGNKSLKNYLYRSILGLLAFSLIAVGGITWMFFRQNTVSYHEKRLSRKTSAIIKDTEHELALLSDKRNNELKQDSLSNQEVNAMLHNLDIKAISKIHKPDINLYDLSGKLIKASDWIIFKKGVISNQMDYPAFYSLAKNKESEYVDNNGQIGKTTYKISFKPINFKNSSEKKVIGYLGFPYYSKKSNLDSDIYGFMGNLLSTYVILFILAGFYGSYISTQIIKPIQSLATKLQDFRIGGTNEIIETKRQDEVGALIDEYNRMTVKLEEGAKNFKQLEKEKAFRDMARSVAHDIKNPLTPMKLHIQFLELSMNSDSDEFKMRVQKTSKTLLEQISHIENIVSSLNVVDNKTEMQKLSLSRMVESAYNLYKPKKDISISLTMPNMDYFISADENQISRVLNNLLTNANQALDEYGDRKIDIVVSEKQNYVVVEVKDSGCGIPKEMYDKILQLNFTTKTTGSGLGLSMVRTIVEDSNGRIYFESEVGEGTSFFIEFPVIDKEPFDFGYSHQGLGA